MKSDVKVVGSSSTRVLLIRPRRNEDEWWDGYVARVVQSNGWKAATTRLLEAQFPLVRMSTGVEPTGALLFSKWGRGEQAFIDDKPIPRWAVYRGNHGLLVCGHCLNEARYVRLAWKVPGYEACLTHRCALSGSCKGCKRFWTVWDVLRGQCPCGLGIGGEQHEAQVGTEEFALATAIWADSMVLHSRESQALALSLLCWRLLLDVARARRGRDVSLRGRRLLEHAAEWLTAENLKLEVSIEGVGRFLSALEMPIHLAAAVACLDQLLTSEQSSPTIIAPLPLSVWREQLRAMKAPEKRLRSLGTRMRQHGDERVFFQNQVALSLGVGGGSMVKLIEAAGIVVKEHRRKQRAYRLIDETEVRKLEVFQGTYVTTFELASAFGIEGKTVLRHLRNSGHLRRSPLLVGHRYMRQDVCMLMDDLSERALPWDASLSLVALTDELLWRYTMALVDRRLLDDLRSGNEPVYRRDVGVGLQQFGVSVALMTKHHARSRKAISDSRGKRSSGAPC